MTRMLKDIAILFVLLAFGCALALSLVSYAFAGDGASATAIDFGPVILSILGLVGAAITALGGVGLRAFTAYLDRKIGLQIDTETRDYLDRAIFNAVGYAQRKIASLPSVEYASIDVGNATVATAATYLLDRVPDALAHFGITEASLRQMIEARLGANDLELIEG